MFVFTMLFLSACTTGEKAESTATSEPVQDQSASEDVKEETEENSGDSANEAIDESADEQVADVDAQTTDDSPRFQPEWSKDAVVYEVNVRQYTQEGTFTAFSEHLQQLKDMGVNVLWFMPIHPISETKRSGILGSYYSVTDYRDVNPEFGTKEDFAALVEQAHEMGFHIMLDWVANHTGWDNAWIKDHPDWYTQDSSGNIISPLNMGWPDVADLNYDNPDMRQEMIDCMKYWVEEYDIDGFRCDFANGVPVDFWEEARVQLESEKPLLMLAEDNKVKELLESAFDFNYNWGLYDTLIALAKDGKNAGTIRMYIPNNYPDGTYTLNFLDNHDKNSYEGTIMEHFGEEALPMMFSLIYTIPGAPLIYTGDEIGLDHAIAFTSKDPVDWDSSDYSYRQQLTVLADIRRNNPALYCGNYGGEIQYYEVESNYVLAFSREKDGNRIKCIFNVTKREHDLDTNGIIDGSETVLMHGAGSQILELEEHPVSEENLSGEVTLQPWEFYILSDAE